MRQAYFISDLHLGAPYFPDSHDQERRVVAFLESIREDCSELYLLGDILDYWYEYRYVVPKGFIRFFGKLAELSDSGIKITWLIGNHDIWMFDYLPSEIGIEVVDGPIEKEIMGRRFLLAHGDGLGKTKRSFKILRSLFRNRICQKLYSGIHPRWTVPFAEKWSRSSRSDSIASMSQKSREERQLIREKIAGNLIDWSKAYSEKKPEIKEYVFGHLHIPVQRSIGDGIQVTILGDWIDKFTYATISEGKKLELHTYMPQEIKSVKK